jgi:dihydrolipoamide dehydrogenase
MDKKYDLAIIGGGPGGYVAAIRAAQLGKKVALIEKDKLGGTCLNYGCIPAKYLLHQTTVFREIQESKNLRGPLKEIKCDWERVQKEKSEVVGKMVKGVEFLLKKNGVEVVKGTGFLKNERQVIVETEGEEKLIEAEKIILAIGSKPTKLPFLAPNGKEVVTSREALEFDSIPRKLLIIGAGAIGLEIGTIYQRLGSDVTILEIMPSILPGSDKEMVTRLDRILKLQGLKIQTRMRIDSAQIKEDKVSLQGMYLETQARFEFKAEKVLLATGRKPDSDVLKKGDFKALLDSQGFFKVNPFLETDMPGIYAIGDMIGGKLLAHKASHEGILAAENASEAKREMDYEALPMAVYTEPEFSSVGLTEEEAREEGTGIKVGLFPLSANGRSLTIMAQEGLVKIIADKKDKVIGAHIIAPNASEFISEVTLAMSKGLRIQDVSSSIHIHPTLSEAVMEAALKAEGKAIHILNI